MPSPVTLDFLTKLLLSLVDTTMMTMNWNIRQQPGYQAKTHISIGV